MGDAAKTALILGGAAVFFAIAWAVERAYDENQREEASAARAREATQDYYERLDREAERVEREEARAAMAAGAVDWHCASASGRCYADKWKCREIEGDCTAQGSTWCTEIARGQTWCGRTEAACVAHRIDGEACAERQ